MGALVDAQPPAPATDTPHVPPPDDFDRPHDTLFRYAFERPEIAEGELRALLPPDVVAALDFTTLTLEPGSLADPGFAQLETDLLYRVELVGAIRGTGQRVGGAGATSAEFQSSHR
jgi:Putative transposase, YhgA-like